MKTQNTARFCQSASRRKRGSALIGSIIVSVVLAVAAAGYLTYLYHEYYMNHRSMLWTQALHLTEAGIEEGFYELNYRYTKGQGFLLSNGWKAVGGPNKPLIPLLVGESGYSKRVVGLRIVDFTGADGEVVGDYTVQVINPGSRHPRIVASAVIRDRVHDTTVTRTIKVTTYERARFNYAIFADDAIDLSGTSVATDSYDSSDPLHSNNRAYDSSKALSNGHVATNNASATAINVSNADIHGIAGSGPGGSISVAAQGTVSGGTRTDVRTDLPPAELPRDFNMLLAFPLGTINGSRLLISGDYVATSINLDNNDTISILGDARIYVTGNVSMTGLGKIVTVGGGSSVEIYADGASVSVGGKGIVNGSSKPKNVLIFGLPNVTSVSFSGNSAMSVCFYAPNADMTMNGSGADFALCGAVVVKSLKTSGNVKIHFDEALLTAPPAIGYRLKSWKEIPTAQ